MIGDPDIMSKSHQKEGDPDTMLESCRERGSRYDVGEPPNR